MHVYVCMYMLLLPVPLQPRNGGRQNSSNWNPAAFLFFFFFFQRPCHKCIVCGKTKRIWFDLILLKLVILIFPLKFCKKKHDMILLLYKLSRYISVCVFYVGIKNICGNYMNCRKSLEWLITIDLSLTLARDRMCVEQKHR